MRPVATHSAPVSERDIFPSYVHLSDDPFDPLEAARLKTICDEALAAYMQKGAIARQEWLKLLAQPSLTARRMVFCYLSWRFKELGHMDYAKGLLCKAWRIGQRDRRTAVRVYSIMRNDRPDLALWTFIKEAMLAATAAQHPGYILEVLGWAHEMAYNAYNALLPYPGFQDCVSVAAVSEGLQSLRPSLPDLQPPEGRALRVCYVLAGECSENYSPLADISFALAEARDPARHNVSILCMHPESEVMAFRLTRSRIEGLRAQGCQFFFWPEPTAGQHIADDLKALAAELAAANLDALVFTTLTNQSFSLAALRPAHLMVGLGLGDIDMYTSPLLDFTAHLGAFVVGDSLCQSYIIPDFIPPARFHQPTKPCRKAMLGVPEDSILIISSGRPIKFFSALYWQVVAGVLARKPQTHFAIIGPTYNQASEWVRRHVPEAALSRIHFLGWRNDHAEVLAAADIALDTIPMAGGYNLFEIMNLGVPTVVVHNKIDDFFKLYDNSIFMPVGEIVTDPELSFDWDDVTGIQNAIVRLIDQPEWRASLAQTMRDIAKPRGDIQPALTALDDLIKKHLENRL